MNFFKKKNKGGSAEASGQEDPSTSNTDVSSQEGNVRNEESTSNDPSPPSSDDTSPESSSPVSEPIAQGDVQHAKDLGSFNIQEQDTKLDVAPGTVVTEENLKMLFDARVVVRTSETYRQALEAAGMKCPVFDCIGRIRAMEAEEGGGYRCIVKWSDGQKLAGYRVGYSDAFDLETAEGDFPDQQGMIQTEVPKKKGFFSKMNPFKKKKDVSAGNAV